MESSFVDDGGSHSSSPPCTPEEILIPFHALHGHEQRLFSSPDDLYTRRNKSSEFNEEPSQMSREQMLQSKQKSKGVGKRSDACLQTVLGLLD